MNCSPLRTVPVTTKRASAHAHHSVLFAGVDDDLAIVGDDVGAVVEETVRFLSVRADGAGWIGDAPDWFGERLFGGFVLGQALHAAANAARSGGDDRRVHSMHGYFLRPVFAGHPISYRIEPVREGRTLAVRHLTAMQRDADVFTMLCSFISDGDGYEYEFGPSDDVADPDALEIETNDGPWEAVWLGPTPPRADGSMTSTHRAWQRIRTTLPDDPALHLAFLGMLTDTTGTGGRPLHLDGDVRGMISLDHAAWFHRPARVDDWLLYDVHSLVNTGGRGTLRGVIRNRARQAVASVAQEMILQPYEVAAPMTPE